MFQHLESETEIQSYLHSLLVIGEFGDQGRKDAWSFCNFLSSVNTFPYIL